MLKVKLQKSPKYSHFRILPKAAERLGIFSIPVRVTFDDAWKQRRYVVSEFLFSPILVLVFIWSLFSDNRLYSGADRFGSTFLFLLLDLLSKLSASAIALLVRKRQIKDVFL